MLQNVRETFAIVRAAMGYVGNAGGTRGEPDAVPAAGADAGGLVGPIVGGGGGDVLEDMAYLYRMIDVVILVWDCPQGTGVFMQHDVRCVEPGLDW